MSYYELHKIHKSYIRATATAVDDQIDPDHHEEGLSASADLPGQAMGGKKSRAGRGGPSELYNIFSFRGK